MKTYLYCFILLGLYIVIFAETDSVVMRINGKEIRKSEFDYYYNKYNNIKNVDKRSLNEFLILFKNFKLKVVEAEMQGIDTTAIFLQEFSEYRDQFAKSYLSKLVTVDEELLLQSCRIAKELFELSFILVKFPQSENNNFSKIVPSDTLVTFQKAVKIRNKALAKGSSFEEVVKEYSSEKSNKQDVYSNYLGWCLGLNLVPTLGIPIFHTISGQITMPIRTIQGYFIIKVHNKKPNPGRVNIAHILVESFEERDSVQILKIKNKISEIYQKLAEGVEFSDLARKYSDDKISAINGGDLSWVEYGQMISEFNDTIFAMTEIGSVSQPVKTKFGYHVIKLLGKCSDISFEELRSKLEILFDKSGYFLILRQKSIDRLKMIEKYVLNKRVYQLLANQANNIFPTDSLYISHFENNNEILFNIAGNDVKVFDFIKFLNENSKTYSNLSSEAFVEKFNQFVYQNIIEIEDKNLESKYPDFKNQIKECRDGILLFEISNNDIWKKSSVDTVGLAQYFEKNKFKYSWNECPWKGAIIFIKNKEFKKKIQKEISKMVYEEAIQHLTNKYALDSISSIKIEKGLFFKGQNKYVDNIAFGEKKAMLPNKTPYGDFFLVGKLLSQLPESYTDVKGLVVADYQDFIEQEWLRNLNEKYTVEIYRDILETVCEI